MAAMSTLTLRHTCGFGSSTSCSLSAAMASFTGVSSLARVAMSTAQSEALLIACQGPRTVLRQSDLHVQTRSRRLSRCALGSIRKARRKKKFNFKDHDEVIFRPGAAIPQPIRYWTRDWLWNILTWPQSTLLQRIKTPVWAFTLWSAILTLVAKWVPFPPLTLTAHTLVGTALGLLLVFRTNSANDRFWEGRRMWERVVSSSRNIVAVCTAYAEHIGTDRLCCISRLVSAFPSLLTDYAQPTLKNGPVAYRMPLKRLLPKQQRKMIGASICPPSRLIQMLLAETTRIPDSADGLFSNRERQMLSSYAAALSDTIGQAERLVQTPIPQSYVRHTSRFLSIWLFTLPLALCHLVGWWTPAVVWVASWALCGIQELGQVIEHPFDGPQSLRLSVMSNTVHAAVTDSLQTAALFSTDRPLQEVDGVDAFLGRTALHHAAYSGDRAAVARLLDLRVDVNAVDSWDGSTPLDVARACNKAAVAQQLLDAGGTSSVFSNSQRPLPWGDRSSARTP